MSLPPTQPVQSIPRPIPRPPAPRPVPRPTYRPATKPVAQPIPYGSRNPLGQSVRVKDEPKVPPQEQWQALANFGTGVSSRSIPQPRTKILRSPSETNSTPTPALLVNNPISQGETRHPQSSAH